MSVPGPLYFLGALLGAQSPKEGSGAYVPSVMLIYTLARLLLVPFIVLFALLLARLLLARGVLAIVTRAGRGIFGGHVALVRCLVRRISAPDLRSTASGRRCYTCRLDRQW